MLAEKEREYDRKKQRLEELAQREEIAQKVSKMAMSKLDAKKQNLNIKLSRLITETENIKNNILRNGMGNYADLLISAIKNATDKEVEGINPLLEEFSSRLEGIKKFGYDPVEKEKAIKEIIDMIETDIEDMPSSYLKFIMSDINEIKHSISDIKRKLSGNYAFYENILKGIKLRLAYSISFAEKKYEENEKLLASIEKVMNELLIDLENIISSPITKDKKKAEALKQSLYGLYKYDVFNNSSFIKSELERLSSEIKARYMEYLELTKNEAERNYIMNSIKDILHEIGYEPIPVEQDTVGKNKLMEMKIPGGEAVRIALGTDKKFSAKVFRPEDLLDASYDAFKAQEEKFCSDLPKLSKKMKEQGMAVNIGIEKKIDASILKEVLKTKKKRREDLKVRRLD